MTSRAATGRVPRTQRNQRRAWRSFRREHPRRPIYGERLAHPRPRAKRHPAAVDLGHLHLATHLVARSYRRAELELLAEVDRARAGQLVGKQRGDQPADQHAVGDPTAKPGLGSVGLVEVDRVAIAGGERELLELLV